MMKNQLIAYTLIANLVAGTASPMQAAFAADKEGNSKTGRPAVNPRKSGSSTIRVSEAARGKIDPLLDEIGKLCGADGPTEPGDKFSCPKAADAAPGLREIVKRNQEQLRNATFALVKETPPALRQLIQTECVTPSEKSGKDPLPCMKSVLEFSHPKAGAVLSEIAKTQPAYNQAHALGLLNSAAKYQILSAVASAACYQSQGKLGPRGPIGQDSACVAGGTKEVLRTFKAPEYAPYQQGEKIADGAQPDETDFLANSTTAASNANKQKEGSSTGKDTENPQNLPDSDKRSTGRGTALTGETKGVNKNDPASTWAALAAQDTRKALSCPHLGGAAKGDCPEDKNAVPTASSVEQAKAALSRDLVYQAIVAAKIKSELEGISRHFDRPDLRDKARQALIDAQSKCSNRDLNTMVANEVARLWDKAEDDRIARDKQSGRSSGSANTGQIDRNEAADDTGNVVEAASRLQEIDAETDSIMKDFYDVDKGAKGSLDGMVAAMATGMGQIAPCQAAIRHLNGLSVLMKSAEAEKNFSGSCSIARPFGEAVITTSNRIKNGNVVQKASCAAGAATVEACMASCQGDASLSEADRRIMCVSNTEDKQLTGNDGSGADKLTSSLVGPRSSPLERCQAKFARLTMIQARRAAYIAKYPELTKKTAIGTPLYTKLGKGSSAERASMADDVAKATKEVAKQLTSDDGVATEIGKVCADPEKFARETLADPAQLKFLFTCGNDARAPYPVPIHGDPAAKVAGLSNDCKFLRQHAQDLCGLLADDAHEQRVANTFSSMTDKAKEAGMATVFGGLDYMGCVGLGFGAVGKIASGAWRAGVRAGLGQAIKYGSTDHIVAASLRTVGGAVKGAVFDAPVAFVTTAAKELGEIAASPAAAKRLLGLGSKGRAAVGAQKGTAAAATLASDLEAVKSAGMFLGFTTPSLVANTMAVKDAHEQVQNLTASCLTGNGSACEQLDDSKDALKQAMSSGAWETMKYAVLGMVVPGSLSGHVPTFKSPTFKKFFDVSGLFKASEKKFNAAMADLGAAKRAYDDAKTPAEKAKAEKAYNKAFDAYNKVAKKHQADGKALRDQYAKVLAEASPNGKNANPTVTDASAAARYLTSREFLADASKGLGRELSAKEADALAAVDSTLLSASGPKRDKFIAGLAKDVKDNKVPAGFEGYAKDGQLTVQDRVYIRAIQEAQAERGVKQIKRAPAEIRQMLGENPSPKKFASVLDELLGDEGGMDRAIAGDEATAPKVLDNGDILIPARGDKPSITISKADVGRIQADYPDLFAKAPGEEATLAAIIHVLETKQAKNKAEVKKFVEDALKDCRK